MKKTSKKLAKEIPSKTLKKKDPRKAGALSVPATPDAIEPSITITFNLFELPTAQHKAGLAGLLMQIDHMNAKSPKPSAIPKIIERTATQATIEFTKVSMQCLLDDVYAAQVAEEWFAQKKPKEHLLGERMKETKSGKYKEYKYEVIQPLCVALAQYFGDGAAGKAWLKLWAKMIWGVPRGINTTRGVYEVVAGWNKKNQKGHRKVQSKPCPEGTKEWSALKKFHVKKNDDVCVDTLNGSQLLGSQKSTAESMPFLGRLDHNLLLHFWPFACLVFVPQALKVKRVNKDVELIRQADGYAIAIPDILDLRLFVARYQETIFKLGQEALPKYGKPHSAIIDVPAQGALSLIDRDHVAGLVQQSATTSKYRRSISGADYFHFRPQKNGPKMLSAAHISLKPDQIIEYHRIVGTPSNSRPAYSNPLFRKAMLLSLLAGTKWFHSFSRLFQEWPAEFFVLSEKSPKKLSRFWADARKKLWEISRAMATAPRSDKVDEDVLLATTINRFVKRYLDARLSDNYDFAAFRKAKSTPPEAAEARAKLAEQLFLEFRSRHGQAFVSYFSNVFCRVGQYFGSEFGKVAKLLITDDEKAKTLTLMSLSANGWIPANQKETTT